VLAVGLMSGTSLDGIDVAFVDIQPRGSWYAFSLLRSRTVPFAPPLRERLLAALPPNEPSPRAVALLDAELGRAFGEAVREVTDISVPDYTASHGLTLYHDGASHTSVQIGDPFVMRDRIGATVITDFRRGDCAAGGQGAPLVPYVDALLFTSDHEETIALNIGGIANLTIVPAGAPPGEVRAWDCGPGNMLIDAFVRERTGGVEQCDRDGQYARAGRVHATLLEGMLADPYFAKAPPKSTGREYFGAAFLARHRGDIDALSVEDGCAVLSALTVACVARDILMYASENARVVISGGGAHNVALTEPLGKRLGRRRLQPIDELGINGDMKEAIAFAVLGYETLRGRAAALPSVTGARYGAVLGSIIPFDLHALAAKVALEVSASRTTL
jgi:anhydro-N-acetylmuramic acid kinase